MNPSILCADPDSLRGGGGGGGGGRACWRANDGPTLKAVLVAL